jgi:predicted CoA-binding protein
MIVEDVAGLRRILGENRVVAVVGLSPSWNRPSYFAAKYMLEHGYTIIPVNPGAAEILGQKCYPDLAAIPLQVDMVDVFRKPEDVTRIADEAIRIGAGCLWLQLGVINQQAAEKAAADEAREVRRAELRRAHDNHKRAAGGLADLAPRLGGAGDGDQRGQAGEVVFHRDCAHRAISCRLAPGVHQP